MGRFARSKGAPPLSRTGRERGWGGSPPPLRIEHPVVIGRRVNLGRLESLPHVAPIEIPVSASPAKGRVVAAIRMLSTFREPGAWGAPARSPRWSPAVDSSSRGPSRREEPCNREVRASFSASYVDACP